MVRFSADRPGLLSVEELLAEASPMVQARDGEVVSSSAPGSGTLAELSSSGEPRRYSRAALEAVTRSLVEAMSRRGYLGVLAAIEPEDLSIEVREAGSPLSNAANVWQDLRPAGNTELRVVLYTARVVQVRTVAQGSRFPQDQSINNPAHARILEFTPLRGSDSSDQSGGDLLRKDLLDDYTLRLNRYPGRRVDAAVSAATGEANELGDVNLDYIVREIKPWTLYFQLANTGTRQTDEWRERFGFIHNQLTNNDDQLVIDYVTAGFSEAHAVQGSYEFPIGERLRLRTFAQYSTYDASQVGQGDSGFEGESYAFGGELAFNVAQFREWFIDLTGGVRWESIEVDNQTALITGRDHFLLPNAGVRVERRTEESSTGAYARFEWNLDEIAGTGNPSLESLGRFDPDEEWVTFQWGVEHAFFLEPLLDGERFRAGQSTLAHEMLLTARGQVAFDSRLAPNFQDVVGGSASVRGYPESVVAGDDVVVGTVEYRLHIPSLLEPYNETGENPPRLFGEEFRLRPQYRYARPDWDLIAKVFFDAGRAENSDRAPFETDETLLGAGAGLELLIGRNLNIKADFGVALEEVEAPTRVTSGSNRIHFSVTVLF